MIIKNPYSFLIKNFRKIHIFLFILCAYAYFKTMQIYSFVKEFIALGTYDIFNEPISKYVTGFSYFAIFLIIVSSVLILILLKYKEKPWKMYLIPIANYLVLLITFFLTANFFNTYQGQLESTTIRALRDVLLIVTAPQYAFFVLLIIRVTGMDLKKFNFQADSEYLELTEKDREEIEINIDVDKESIKRGIKRFIRNSGYVYKEHRRKINLILSIVALVGGISLYSLIFVTNKVYKEGEALQNSGYSIVINNSYYTDKDYKGDIVDKKNNFIIVDVTITNLANKRKINFNRFHVMSGINNYSPTSKTYETYFNDLGTAYEDKTILNGESFNTILIYKVDKKLKKNSFVMYYQELHDDNTNYLRKIKLKMNDLTNIAEQEPKSLTEDMLVKIENKEEEISFNNLEFTTTTMYSKRKCADNECYPVDENFTIAGEYKILKMDFSSDDMDGKDMIDFLTKYGKINYIDSKDESKSLNIVNAIGKTYYGKYVYIKVPLEVEFAKEINLDFVVRNNKYTYKLR